LIAYCIVAESVTFRPTVMLSDAALVSRPEAQLEVFEVALRHEREHARLVDAPRQRAMVYGNGGKYGIVSNVVSVTYRI
jgi:hypothetical protein